MAATVLPVQQAKISAATNFQGASPNTPDTINGNVFTNTGRELVLIQTQAASGITPTITPFAKALGVLPVPSPSYAIVASSLVALGPFDVSTYNGNQSGSVVAASGQVAISWSGLSGTVNVWIVQLPQTPV